MSEAASDAAASALKQLNYAEAFTLWDKYEQVAIHFNDMLIKWRIQVLSGLAALVTIAGIITHEVADKHVAPALGLVCLALAPVWMAVAALDLLYYSRLLSGAVDGILQLEQVRPELKLSTHIHAATHSGWYRKGTHVFYGLILLALLGCFAASKWWFVSDDAQAAHPLPASTIATIFPATRHTAVDAT